MSNKRPWQQVTSNQFLQQTVQQWNPDNTTNSDGMDRWLAQIVLFGLTLNGFLWIQLTQTLLSNSIMPTYMEFYYRYGIQTIMHKLHCKSVTIKTTKENKSYLYKIILPKLLLLEKNLKKVENLFLQTYLLVIKPVLFRKYIFRYKILCKHVNKIVCGNHNWNRHGHFWIHIYKNKMNQN